MRKGNRNGTTEEGNSATRKERTEKQQRRCNEKKEIHEGRGQRGGKRKKLCINSQARTEVMGWKDS